jgi:hypothetical protein
MSYHSRYRTRVPRHKGTRRAGRDGKQKEERKKVTYKGGRFGSVVQLTGCGRLFLRWCWGRAGGILSSCTALAPDQRHINAFIIWPWSKGGCKICMGQTLFRDGDRDLNDTKTCPKRTAQSFTPHHNLTRWKLRSPLGPNGKSTSSSMTASELSVFCLLEYKFNRMHLCAHVRVGEHNSLHP